jgi:hypothetical protein
MAQLNQMQWNQRYMQQNAQNFNGSNMSLNLPPSGYYPQQHAQMGTPAGWMNQWAAPNYPYPYPVGMVPVMPSKDINTLLRK